MSLSFPRTVSCNFSDFIIIMEEKNGWRGETYKFYKTLHAGVALFRANRCSYPGARVAEGTTFFVQLQNRIYSLNDESTISITMAHSAVLSKTRTIDDTEQYGFATQ